VYEIFSRTLELKERVHHHQQKMDEGRDGQAWRAQGGPGAAARKRIAGVEKAEKQFPSYATNN